MTKSEIVTKIATKHPELSERQIEIVVNSFMDIVKLKLSVGETIYLRKFGTFLPRKRKAKVARDISRDTIINVPERTVPFFKPSKEFKNQVSKTVKK